METSCRASTCLSGARRLYGHRRRSRLLLSVCIVPLICSAQDELAGQELVHFTYAEGYASQTLDGAIELAFRSFALHSRPCDGLPRTETAVAEPAQIALRVGERYRLSDLVLRVYDLMGAVVPRAPLHARLEYPSGVLAFESDNDRSFTVLATGVGRGTAYFDAGCGDEYRRPLLVEVPIIVRP